MLAERFLLQLAIRLCGKDRTLAAGRATAVTSSGLCALATRTTRQCWSFSTSDGRVCRWKVEEAEGQWTAEAAARLRCEKEALEAHATDEAAARAQEQQVHASERAADAAALAARDVALEEARERGAAVLTAGAGTLDG